jgi:hypothetical protein
LHPLPLITPSTSAATFQIHVAIFSHMLFASPSSFQGPSSITLSLKTFDASPSNFHHFVLAILACLTLRARIRKRKSVTANLCWETTHSPGITSQSTQARLSPLLVRTKLI